MKVSMMLADAATTRDGVLYILGGGWNKILTPAPHALAISLHTSVSPVEQNIEASAYLLDENGNGVIEQTGAESFAPIRIDMETVVNPGAPSDIMLPFVVTLYPLPLGPNKTYTWCVDVNEEHQEDWELTFRTGPEYPDIELMV